MMASTAPQSKGRNLMISAAHTEVHRKRLRRRFGGLHGGPPYPDTYTRYSFIECTTKSLVIKDNFDTRKYIGTGVIAISSSAASRSATLTLFSHPQLSTQALTPLKRTVAAEHHRHRIALFCPPPLHSLSVSPTKRAKSSHRSI